MKAFFSLSSHNSHLKRFSTSSFFSHTSYLRKRFTLIELLIVVAIIAILAGMLLPALNKAKQKAVDMSCKSNLKQLQFGYMLYLDTYKEWLPSQSLGIPPGEQYNNYFIDNITKLTTPKTKSTAGRGLWGKKYYCPAPSRKAADITRREGSTYCDFALNRIGGSNGTTRATTLHMNGYDDHLKGTGLSEGWKRYKLKDINQPSVCIVMGDNGLQSSSAATYSSYFDFTRHHNYANFAYMDQHVETISVTKANALPGTTNNPTMFRTGWIK